MLKNSWFVARKDVQYLLRERATIVWLFLMPILFFYFIGTVTSGFSSGPSSAALVIAVKIPSDAGILADQVVRRLQENGYEIVKIVTSDPEAEEIFLSNSLRLEIPAHFTDLITNGQPVGLKFSNDEENLQREFHSVKVQRAVYTVLADLVVSSAKGAPANAEFFGWQSALPRAVTLSVMPAGKRREIPSGFEQAIPGTMVMFTLLVLLTSGSTLLVIEREKGLLRRLASTPISHGEVVLGKWGGKMILGIIQILFGMLVGTLLFQMNWGSDLAMLIFVLFAWGAFCASFGLLLGCLGKTESQVAGLGVLASLMLAALGGAWWPIEITPSWMQSFQMLLPSGWAMNAMHKLISFEAGAQSVLPHVLLLLSSALLMGWIGSKRFRFQ